MGPTGCFAAIFRHRTRRTFHRAPKLGTERIESRTVQEAAMKRLVFAILAGDDSFRPAKLATAARRAPDATDSRQLLHLPGNGPDRCPFHAGSKNRISRSVAACGRGSTCRGRRS